MKSQNDNNDSKNNGTIGEIDKAAVDVDSINNQPDRIRKISQKSVEVESIQGLKEHVVESVSRDVSEQEEFISKNTSGFNRTPFSFDYAIDQEQLQEFCQKLDEFNVLVLHAFDAEYARFTAEKVMMRMSCQKFITKLAKSSEDSGIVIESFIQHSFLSNLLEEQPRYAVCLDAWSLDSVDFWSGTLFDRQKASGIIHSLQKNNGHLVIVCNTPYFNDMAMQVVDGEPAYSVWGLDFLYGFLGKRNDYNQLRKTLMSQKQQNGWGKDEEEFYEHVNSYFRLKEPFDESLVQRIMELEEQSEKKPGLDLFEESKEVKVSELVKSFDKIDFHVVLTVCLLPDISVEEFDNVIAYSLDSETMEIEKPIQETTKKGKVVEKLVKEKVSLQELWKNQKDERFEKLFLKVGLSQMGEERVIFRYPYMHKDFMSYLTSQRPFLLRDYFGALPLESLLLCSSVQTLDNTIQLIVEFIKKNHEYSDFWVRSLVIRDDETEIKPEKMSIEELIEYLFMESENKPLDRMIKIIERMMKYSELVPVVENVLSKLIINRRYSDVFQVLKRIKNYQNLNVLQFYRKMFYSTLSRETLNEMSGSFQHYLRKKETGIENTLLEVRELLPLKNSKNGQYNEFQKWIAGEIIRLITSSVREVDPERYGQWPSSFLFLKDCTDSSECKSINIIFEFLNHSIMLDAFLENQTHLEFLVNFVWGRYEIFGVINHSDKAVQRSIDGLMTNLFNELADFINPKTESEKYIKALIISMFTVSLFNVALPNMSRSQDQQVQVDNIAKILKQNCDPKFLRSMKRCCEKVRYLLSSSASIVLTTLSHSVDAETKRQVKHIIKERMANLYYSIKFFKEVNCHD